MRDDQKPILRLRDAIPLLRRSREGKCAKWIPTAEGPGHFEVSVSIREFQRTRIAV
jgi:hypothetical protein